MAGWGNEEGTAGCDAEMPEARRHLSMQPAKQMIDGGLHIYLLDTRMDMNIYMDICI